MITGQSGTTGEAKGSSNESATGQPDISSRETDSSHGLVFTKSSATTTGTKSSYSTSSTYSGAKPEEMLQGADRPGEEPSGEQVTAIRDEREHHKNIQARKYPTADDSGTAGVERTYGGEFQDPGKENGTDAL